MREVFADSFYWIALTDFRDPWHQRALAASRDLGSAQLVTSEPVLFELFNHFCEFGPIWRDQVLRRGEAILTSQFTKLLPYGPDTLQRGMEFFAARRDKGYSLTDCISMREMRDRGIFEVLTHDGHFAQEGFVLLL